MSYQHQIHPAGRNTGKTKTFLLYPVFCILLFATFLFTASASYAQSATPEEGVQVWSVAAIPTDDNGYMVIGGALDPTGANLVDCWLMKLDGDGNPQWFDTFGGSQSDIAGTVIQTDDGGYAVAGHAYSPDTKLADGWLLKVDSQGNEQWQENYGADDQDDLFNSVQQTGDGGYMLAGSSTTPGGDAEGWIVKLSPEGHIKWQKTFGMGGHDFVNAAKQTPDGGFTVVGETISLDSGLKDGWIVRLNAEGNKQWSKVFGGESDEEINDVWLTDDGGYVVAGSTESFGSGGEDLWVVKLDSTGETEWQMTYGGEEDDVAYSVQQTADGGYIVAGSTSSYGTNGDSWIIKLDAEGNVQWHKVFGEDYYDMVTSIRQTDDGGYIASGSSYLYGPEGEDLGRAFWVAKFDPEGNLLWYRTKWQAQ